ncbi:MAG: helix-turn-helix transcriptional regulator [Phycisphaerales bacterium]
MEYARATLARKIIAARTAAGLTQRALAQAAGMSFEHLNRIESAKHSPNVTTVAKLGRALRQSGGASPQPTTTRSRRPATKPRTNRKGH